MRIRHFDWFLAVCFAFFAIGSAIADIPSALGIEASPTSPNPFGRIAHAYAAGCDPLTLRPPGFMRVITGIRVPALAYAAAITALNSVYFGVAFFGEPEWRCQNPATFLAATLPYAIVPLLLAVRMRRSAFEPTPC